ncbi:MAG TPA: hypothetical protein VMT11_10225 [Myxococcaceae bacterium]|nr:hypothetical protein [Myxococcaceae bacterium]
MALLASGALIACWALVALAAWRARGLNAALLGATLVAAAGVVAVPIASLVVGFQRIALAAGSEKRAMVDGVIDGARPAMFLAVTSLPMLAWGIAIFRRNRARAAIRSAASRSHHGRR